MGLVALTAATFALGAYLGRDMSYRYGWLFFIASFACLFGMQFAIRKSEQLAIFMLFGFGLLVGLAVAPDDRLLRRHEPSGRLAGRRCDGALHRRLRHGGLRDPA